MSSTKFTIAIAASTLAFTSSAQAQFAYISQERTVTATTDAGTESFSAPDFGFFNETATSSSPPTSSFATASQMSSLGDFEISAEGGANGSGLNAFLAQSSSRLDVTFAIGVTTSYELIATTISGSGPGEGRVRLYGPGDVLLADTFDTGFLSQSGIFEPGEYRVVAGGFYANSFDGADPQGSFDFTLTIPTPGTAGLLGIAGLASVRRRRSC